ncbi:hypothetical protein IFM89_011473 [Coptis chinensis]|uniref:GDSL esterase/lipase n=1 Tax=Coptis chinensis TaxID=261450 RepID=A0A835IV95_9MAGN|nr:hypothetical protein IFM89_011473 [Coptis chinensis]
MANYYCIAFLFFSSFLDFLLVKCESPLAPALYVFGDSLSDSGNNNFLKTEAKVNYKPYGIDFPSGATGRFTNGKTFVDFIAQSLRLPYAPPYLGLSAKDKINIKTGVNYASGSAGILLESGTALGENLSFDKQINYFQDTTGFLKTISADLQTYLSNSIFVISIGSNDYINNYLQPARYKSSKTYTPQEYADLLLNGLVGGLKKLYSLGARKFVVFNIGRIEDANNLVLYFNKKFPRTIAELERSLVGSTFVRGDIYRMNQTSSEAGISTVQTSCCAVGGNGLCLRGSPPCSRVTEVWDAFHPTEVVNKAVASDCFGGSTFYPILNLSSRTGSTCLKEFFLSPNMINVSFYLLFTTLFLHLISLKSVSTDAPALYVFGDSLLDCGNNNFLVTLARANFPPYGVDFSGGASGRFTNGKTVADITAQLLGLPFAPSYMDHQNFQNLTGVNYASGASGILAETGTNLGERISLDQQISLFLKTVEEVLQPKLGSKKDLNSYLSKSIFMRLYRLGARKIIIFELGPIGCMPTYTNRFKPIGPCLEYYNQLISHFNSQLSTTLDRLTNVLPGSLIINGQINALVKNIIENPSNYGFIDTKNPCCIAGDGTLACTPALPPCMSDDRYLWWDGYHLTEAAYSIIAKTCYSGSHICSPFNIKKLAQK